MKEILVTVKEFCDNGGKLELERQFYNGAGAVNGWFAGYGGENNDIILTGKHTVTFPCAIETTYVKIKATPIYE